MELGSLTAISPVDGRYRDKVKELAGYFSESGLIRYRILVEVEYFIALCELGIHPLQGKAASAQKLRPLYLEFEQRHAERVKEIEKTTNHDVKAVEYFIKENVGRLAPELEESLEFIHFGLTSQDINNTAVPMSLRDALQEQIIPAYAQLADNLDRLAAEWDGIPLLARTHGQPASPTRLGKEMKVFATRLHAQIDMLRQLSYPAKFGGATGNLNAHTVAYPKVDWHQFATEFVEGRLGLSRSHPTTQIEHYDGLAAIFDNLCRLNTILIDFSVDVWLYVSMEYFKQRTVAGEIGSSAMPHKVNPIDFENAEGNLGFANAVMQFLGRKLPVSRLQRDLTDSTLMRNIGVGLAHTWIALQSIRKGIGKLEVNRDKIAADLEANWAVVAEAIQTILRREGYPNPYEKLKELTRGKSGINAEAISNFIATLDVSDDLKAELSRITPHNYTGQ
jgi:adenylosuccinate lyase